MAIGSYKGVDINGGTQSEIQAQVNAINARGNTPATNPAATPTPTGNSSDPFISALQDKLLSQSSLISSSNSGIEDKISKAISGVNSANDSSNAVTTIDYNRQIGDAQQLGQQKFTTAEEAQRGFATNTALMQNIQDTTLKNVNDLEQRKQELILQGNAAAASKISDIQLQALQFQQQSQQQVFTNLLGMANFGLQAQSANAAQEAQSFTEKNAISDVALKYGLTVQPGDTIDSITTRAAPFASAAQQLSLEQTRSAIRENNAQTQAALAAASRSSADSKPLDAQSIALLADAYANGTTAVMSFIKNPTDAASVIGGAKVITDNNTKKVILAQKANGVSKNDAIASVTTNQNLSAVDQINQLKLVEDAYGATPAPKPFSVGGSFNDLANWFAGNVLNEPKLK